MDATLPFDLLAPTSAVSPPTAASHSKSSLNATTRISWLVDISLGSTPGTLGPRSSEARAVATSAVRRSLYMCMESRTSRFVTYDGSFFITHDNKACYQQKLDVSDVSVLRQLRDCS